MPAGARGHNYKKSDSFSPPHRPSAKVLKDLREATLQRECDALEKEATFNNPNLLRPTDERSIPGSMSALSPQSKKKKRVSQDPTPGCASCLGGHHGHTEMCNIRRAALGILKTSGPRKNKQGLPLAKMDKEAASAAFFAQRSLKFGETPSSTSSQPTSSSDVSQSTVAASPTFAQPSFRAPLTPALSSTTSSQSSAIIVPDDSVSQTAMTSNLDRLMAQNELLMRELHVLRTSADATARSAMAPSSTNTTTGPSVSCAEWRCLF